MMLFFSTHANFLVVPVVCATLFTYSFLKAAYGETDRRTRIVSVITSAYLLVFCSQFAYSEWQGHRSILMFCLLGIMVLLELNGIVQTVPRIIAAGERDAVTDKPVYRHPPVTARTLRFGPHELFVEADRIAGRRHYHFVDSIWPL